MKKVGKNLILFFAIGAMMVSVYSGISVAATETESVSTSVGVAQYQGLTLKEANGADLTDPLKGLTTTRNFSWNRTGFDSDNKIFTYDKFYTPSPNQTSWYDTPDDDGWSVEDNDTNRNGYAAVSRITAVCVNNVASATWNLKVKATILTGSSGDLPFFDDKDNDAIEDEDEYAYYGWTAASDSSQGNSNGLNKHTKTIDGSEVMESYKTEETAYTSTATETGAKIPIWTGLQIPFDQKQGTYSSTVTFTLTY
jgi:hypothetical protein